MPSFDKYLSTTKRVAIVSIKIIVFVTLVIIVLIFIGAWLFRNFYCEDVMLMRKASPDKKLEVVMIRGDCGATTSYDYNVYIVPAGDDYDEKNRVF